MAMEVSETRQKVHAKRNARGEEHHDDSARDCKEYKRQGYQTHLLLIHRWEE